jgi:GTP-binding protein
MVIHTAKFLLLSPSFDKCPVANKPEYALIGRSNVGKLSVINMRTGQKNLAKTSATPWKTQLINYFLKESSNVKKQKQKWYLVDLPGYG